MKPPEDKRERKTLSIPESAALINVPTATIWYAVKSGVIPSFKRGRAIYVTRHDLLQVAAQLQRKDKSPKQAVAGELAGECFERFTQGQDPVTIVRELRQDPTVVDRLWDQWRALQEKYHQTRPASCVLVHKGPCSGPPSLEAMLCAAHAEHATVLTQEETAVLSGKEIPTGVRCESCDVLLTTGQCSTCLASTRVTVEGALLVIRTGRHVLKTIQLTDLGLSVTELKAPSRVKLSGRDAKNMIAEARHELGIK